MNDYKEVFALCEKLGLPMASKKTEGPCTRLIFLGIELDTEEMCMRLGEKRITDLRQLLNSWGERTTCTLKELQSLTGKLHFAAIVVRRGRAYLRRLIDLQKVCMANRDSGATVAVPLSHEARRDIIWWRDHIATWNGHSLLYDLEWTSAEKLELHTDACKEGYGAHWGPRWLQGKWDEATTTRAQRKKGVSMPFLELLSLVQAAATWGPHWTGRKIIFHCDCLPVVMAIRKNSSRSGDLMKLLRHLDTIAARHGFDYGCQHIQGVANVVADALSRECSFAGLQAAYATFAAAALQADPRSHPTLAPNAQADVMTRVPYMPDL